MPNIENIVDELCIKRLLLSHNTDIDILRELDYKKIKKNTEIMNNITKRITENFCHIACIFKGQLYNKNILMNIFDCISKAVIAIILSFAYAFS
jgi:hypothetical protein